MRKLIRLPAFPQEGSIKKLYKRVKSEITHDEEGIPNKLNILSISKKFAKETKKCCPKILIVDDDEFNILALSKLILIFGYESEYATDGKIAIDMIQKKTHKDCGCHSYDLVFMDCNMPIMNGYDTCIKLKKMMSNKEINPIYLVAVTADITKQNIKKCKISGFQKILAKPVIVIIFFSI